MCGKFREAVLPWSKHLGPALGHRAPLQLINRVRASKYFLLGAPEVPLPPLLIHNTRLDNKTVRCCTRVRSILLRVRGVEKGSGNCVFDFRVVVAIMTRGLAGELFMARRRISTY